jgi:DoxX.
MTYILWIVQILLALLFLLAGSMKFIMSVEDMNAQSKIPLPGLFIHFIGVCEILGAIGLILPWLLKIRPGLTPLAASGLVIIMMGAVVITVAGGDIAPAILPAVLGLLAAFVAWGRSRETPVLP